MLPAAPKRVWWSTASQSRSEEPTALRVQSLLSVTFFLAQLLRTFSD